MQTEGKTTTEYEDCPRPLRRVSEACIHIAAVILQIAAVLIVVNAGYRYLLGGGFGVISELSRFTLLVIVFLSLAGTHLIGGHVQVELLNSKLGPKLRAILANWIVPIASIGFLCLIFYTSWEVTLQMFNRGTTTPSRPAIPLWPFMAIVAFGSGLLVCVLAGSIANRLWTKKIRRTGE